MDEDVIHENEEFLPFDEGYEFDTSSEESSNNYDWIF